MGIGDDLDIFLDREDEIGAFTRLLSHSKRRILLLYGLKERGKTRLLHQLREDCCDEHTLSTLVDFRIEKTLTEPDSVISRLREQIGGRFDREMGQAEYRIRQELAAVPVSQPASFAEALAAALPAQARGSTGGVHLSGIDKVQVGGSIVGGHQVTLRDCTFISDPGAGPEKASDQIENQRNIAFRAALKNLQAEQKVVLFFDHFEDATGRVPAWLQEHVLTLHLKGSDEFSNLWSVIAGRRVPLQDEVDAYCHRLSSLDIGPLPEEAILLYWVDACGLDRAIVKAFIQGSGGNTQMLCLCLKNYAQAPRAEQTGG